MIVIVDYGMGNLGSIVNMLKKVRAEAIISSNVSDIEQASKIILPGVGAFDTGMRKLNDRGLINILNTKVIKDKTPILGVCLGMQLFTQNSEEGTLPGLGWFDAVTVRFDFKSNKTNLKIPHMGWNSIKIRQQSPLWMETQTEEDKWFYFVHSYHVVCRNEANVLATSFNGYEFTSAIIKDNIIGTQFHPEKSHKYGMNLMKSFADNA